MKDLANDLSAYPKPATCLPSWMIVMTRSKLIAGGLAGFLSCVAFVARSPEYDAWLFRVGDYKTLHSSWGPEAYRGEAEKQERLAELLLGPHGRKVKARPYEGPEHGQGYLSRLSEKIEARVYGKQKQ